MIRACSASDESGSPRSACTVSVCRNAIRTKRYQSIAMGAGCVGRTHLTTDVVEQRAEYLYLCGQYVGRVPLVEPVPHELLEERFGRSDCAEVERDGLYGHGGAARESHGDIFIIVEEGATRRHHREIARMTTY